MKLGENLMMSAFSFIQNRHFNRFELPNTFRDANIYHFHVEFGTFQIKLDTLLDKPKTLKLKRALPN